MTFGIDVEEEEILMRIMQVAGLSTIAAVLDVAVWKFALHLEVPMSPQAFALGKKGRSK